MGKTLHIIPSGSIWPRIVGKWIGEGPDKSDHEVTQYPVPTNIHYLPEDLTDVEMMKTVISWHKPNSYQAGDLYRDLINTIETVWSTMRCSSGTPRMPTPGCSST